LLAGRYFNANDDDKHPLVAIVDELLARQTWPGQDALGKKLKVEVIKEGDFKQEWATVVGIVRHVRYHSLAQQVRPQIYLSYMQSPRPQLQMAFAVRTQGDLPEWLPEKAKATVANLDKDLPVSKLRPLDAYVETARIRSRFLTLLSGTLGLIAVLLACVGIYGVTSCTVAQSTSEIGLRLALGAARWDIVRLILSNSMMAIVLGTVAGLLGSAAISPLLSSLLFEVKPLDPLTFAWVVVIVLAVGLLACVVPARRASRMDPVRALRYE
jgi:hypothetical protein